MKGRGFYPDCGGGLQDREHLAAMRDLFAQYGIRSRITRVDQSSPYPVFALRRIGEAGTPIENVLSCKVYRNCKSYQSSHLMDCEDERSRAKAIEAALNGVTL